MIFPHQAVPTLAESTQTPQRNLSRDYFQPPIIYPDSIPIIYRDHSQFDLFKIGPGPSSSHTIGPMSAAGNFLNLLKNLTPDALKQARCLRVLLYGSLSLTGRGMPRQYKETAHGGLARCC